MKIVKVFVASVSVAILAVSCQKNVEEIAPVQEKAQLTTITCAFPSMTDQNGTKVSLDASGNTGWQEGDKIVIYGKRNHDDVEDHPELDKVIHTLTASEVSDPSVAVFSVDLSGLTPDPAGNHPYNAVYPADESDDYLPFYSPWGASGRARFKDTNKHLLAGWIDGGVMTLKNVCAAIVFTVSGDFDTYYFTGYDETETVGYGQYLVEFNNSEDKPEAEQYYKKPGEEWGCKNPLTTISGPVVSDGTTLNHIYFPNEVSLPKGFTITFAKGGKKLKTITSGKALTLSHDHMISLGLLPSEKMKDYSVFTPAQLASAYDLGGTSAGTANCYVVSEYGDTNDNKMFKFKAVKGNDAGTSVGDVVSAEVLWETYNDNSTVTAKSIIELVDYIAPYVYFKTPSSLHAGNAVIAVKDSEGTILWSWHIWVPATTITDLDNGLYSSEIMDRNLGALRVATASTDAFIDVTSIGLVYQWGRKDPFLGPDKVKTDSYRGWAAYTGSASFSTEAKVLSMAESIKNPTLMATGTSTNGNWLSPYDAELWGDSGDKTIYDPCPPGYRVPKRDKSHSLFADGTLDSAEGGAYNDTYYWFTLGDPVTVFPCAGYRSGSDFKTTFRTIIWNAHSDSYQGSKEEPHYAAYNRRVYIESGTFKYRNDSSQYKNLGGSVRCVAE